MPKPRPSLSDRQREEFFWLGGGRCWICGEPIFACGPGMRRGERWEDDHQVARWLTQDDRLSNRKPACYRCHREKSSKDTKEYWKCRRISEKAAGLRRSKHPLPASRSSPLKKPLHGPPKVRLSGAAKHRVRKWRGVTPR